MRCGQVGDNAADFPISIFSRGYIAATGLTIQRAFLHCPTTTQCFAPPDQLAFSRRARRRSRSRGRNGFPRAHDAPGVGQNKRSPTRSEQDEGGVRVDRRPCRSGAHGSRTFRTGPLGEKRFHASSSGRGVQTRPPSQMSWRRPRRSLISKMVTTNAPDRALMNQPFSS
jgi:hypothetical protein